MSITICNTRPEQPIVTLFGQLDDGTYDARVMEETEVPYTRCWDNALDQVMVYIEPDDEELKTMLTALNEGTLDYLELQKYGSSSRGISTIPI